MQNRKRRPHGIKTRKVSISVSADDLRVLSSRAKRMHSGNVSAVVHEMVDAIRRLEAADRALELLGGHRVTERDLEAIRQEVSLARRGGRRRRPAA